MIQQDENDHHRHQHHQLQFLVGMLKQFKLSAGECHTGSPVSGFTFSLMAVLQYH